MNFYPFLAAIQDRSKPGLPERVPVAIERWFEAAEPLGSDALAFARSIAADPKAQGLLAAIFGNSPFLTECWLANPCFAADLLTKGPDRIFAEILAGINDELAALPHTETIMQRLRIAKARMALTVAIADIAGLWPLERITESLSDFAASSLDVAAGHLAAKASAEAGEELTPLKAREGRGGLIILGMGKLGARELNYSSDIDLIILFDPDRTPAALRAKAEGRSFGQIYVKLARDIVRMLDERTRDGYVFRTDLRLRPDPASTPLAVSVRAAEIYYESVGQNWERAAMIKARPVAGDREAGAIFLKRLRPFLWRRNLDFAAINDIHSIKRQINAERGGAEVAVYGHDVKLGRGGIREIEFFAQTQQLIWGGRDPSLRVSGTCAALDALAAAGRVGPRTAGELKGAYGFLRRVEHRIQMVEDQQTHKLPTDEAGLQRLALFLGYESAETFATELRQTLGLVESHYAQLFEEAPSLSAPGNLVFTGKEDDPATLETLRGMGFRDPTAMSETIRGWHHGRIRATRSARARELLTELIPRLLTALGATAEPDPAFARFDRFISNLPAGVELFSLFYANPELLELVAWIMGTAPGLAESLGSQPHLLDSVITDPVVADALPARDALLGELRRALKDARAVEEAFDVVRRWSSERRFKIGLAMLEGQLAVAAGTRHFSDVADAVIIELLARVETAFAELHGEVPDGRFAVLALGKLGAQELAPGSDLDLVFVYEAAEDAQSSGPKNLPASLYYQRLGQRLISALTAPTAEGALYQVDMRLRPSGNKGPIASEFGGFVRYQEEEAWTWEHMALTRARVIAGSAGFSLRISRSIQAVLASSTTPDRLIVDIDSMRKRIRQERPGTDPFDVKNRPGGLIDVEFLTQYLILRHAGRHPGVVSGNTAIALAELKGRDLIAPQDADALIRAQRLWSTLQALLRLTLTGHFDPAIAPSALKAALARAAGAVDFAELERNISVSAGEVQAIYARLLGDPAARLGPPTLTAEQRKIDEETQQ
jgi:glutamate-ammonia-ligase adenylyltransferase